MNYVYYLFDSTTDQLLYIGRTDCLRRRKSAFTRRTGLSVYFGMSQRFLDFDMSCIAELRAILKHQPPYNRIVASSLGFKGSQHSSTARNQISTKNQGRSINLEVRKKISSALQGRAPTSGMTGKKHTSDTICRLKQKAVSAETRARMSASAKKKVFTPEHRRNLSIAISKAKQCNTQPS